MRTLSDYEGKTILGLNIKDDEKSKLKKLVANSKEIKAPHEWQRKIFVQYPMVITLVSLVWIMLFTSGVASAGSTLVYWMLIIFGAYAGYFSLPLLLIIKSKNSYSLTPFWSQVISVLKEAGLHYDNRSLIVNMAVLFLLVWTLGAIGALITASYIALWVFRYWMKKKILFLLSQPILGGNKNFDFEEFFGQDWPNFDWTKFRQAYQGTADFVSEEQLEKYRKILGVNKSAGLNEIKQAYRKLAKKHHPDKLRGQGKELTREDKKRIRDINEAYGVLSDQLDLRKHPGE